jgi:RimJ/RimL family protein N-acetyltransferase
MVRTLSTKLWQIDWLTLQRDWSRGRLASEFNLQLAEPEAIKAFSSEHFAQIYVDTGQQYSRSVDWAVRDVFYAEAVDCFAFYAASGDMVGFVVANSVDWETYYLRNASFLPAFQQKGIYQEFLHILLPFLATAGVVRVTGDVAPGHHGHIHILNKLGFKIVGTQVSERFGAQLCFAKYLNPERELQFLQAYSLFHGVKPVEAPH